MTILTVQADDLIAYDVEAYKGDDARDAYSVVNQRVRVKPYSQEDRALAARRRGRGGFSYGSSVCILPSARFYNPGEAERILDAAARESGYVYD